MCDIITSAVLCDCCIINGGSLRSDRMHLAGKFKIRDLRDILSFQSELVVVAITGLNLIYVIFFNFVQWNISRKGSQLHQLLENCLSKYGQGGGRYPQVSNLSFAFDPAKEAGKRIDSRLIEVKQLALDLDKVNLKIDCIKIYSF